MACFIAPTAEAVVVTVAKKVIEKKEKEQIKVSADLQQSSEIIEDSEKISLSKKIGWLKNLLWGGSFLLLIEHIWHGEIVPCAPFLTAMGSPEDTQEMINEIATVGASMAVLVTVVWTIMLAVVKVKESGKAKEKKLS